MGTRGSFPGGKAAGAWSWSLTSIYCRRQRMSGAIPLLLQYVFIVWYLVKAQGHLYLSLYL
jgi:membrane-associated phospholipid phosphatase